MDIGSIVSELKAERNRIDQAITILEASSIHPGQARNRRRAALAAPHRAASVRHTPSVGKRRRHLTPEGRRRLSQLMKQRWAERRKKAA
jgi:Spy/CpxP family protein refolding chaperone